MSEMLDIESARSKLKQKLKELNQLETDLLDQSEKLAIDALELSDYASIKEIQSPKVGGYDRRLFLYDHLIPDSLEQAGGSKYYWGQFECPVSFLSVQEIVEAHKSISEIRNLFEQKVRELVE